MTKDDFIQLVIEWNQGSPHKTNIIPNITWNGEHNIRYGDEYLWLDIKEYKNKDVIAVRYEKREADGVIWDTDYIMNFVERKMAIRLDRSYTADAFVLDSKFSTPHFITLLIDKGYLEYDSDLPVIRTPYIITEKKLDLLSNIINGNKRYRLPVVYVSRTRDNEVPVEIEILAEKLKGIAHVLVQEHRNTNFMLRTKCNDNNEYFGAIGIYYPNQTYGQDRYSYRGATNKTFVFRKIVAKVIQYCNTQMVDALYTWQGVNNALLRERLQVQMEKCHCAEEERRKVEENAKLEMDSFLEGLDEDMQRLQKQVEDLTHENEKLQYENHGLRLKCSSSCLDYILRMGNEYDFYEGEIKDIILDILSDSLSKIPAKSRRADIVKDIIESNNNGGKLKSRTNELKSLLKDYSGMSSRIRQGLHDLGFEITEVGKHYKLTYYGDDRYYTSLSKTPSDNRTGRNSAQQIVNSMF